MADFLVGGESTSNGLGSNSHSRDSSMSSERSSGQNNLENAYEEVELKGQNKENAYENVELKGLRRQDSDSSDLSNGQLILRDGGRLQEESRTDMTKSGYFNAAFNGIMKSEQSEGGSGSGSEVGVYSRQSATSGPGTARQKVSKSGNQAVSVASSIPEEDIDIPNDGNLSAFTADAMATFLRYLRLEDRLVNHLHRQGLDGRRFGRLKDSELESLKLRNPVLVFFRDRTAPAVSKKSKPRLPFVL